MENDKAQFLETRKLQRTIIAAALGVPPSVVGDLENSSIRANVEQQSQEFTTNVILPVAQAFEAAMERDLLTDEDRRGGVIIRFNLDAVLRADYKTRVEGHRLLHETGAVNTNEIREKEGYNPISEEDGGEEYWRPSNMGLAGEPVEPAVPKPNGANGEAPRAVTVAREEEPKRLPDLPKWTLIDQREQPTVVNISMPPPQVLVTNEVQTPVVHVSAAKAPDVHVEVAAPTVNVEPAAIRVMNQVETPVINVAGAQVHVAPTPITVEPAQVHVTSEAPQVHVAAPTVNIEPIVVKAPDVTVQPDIVVPVPNVTVTNRLPEYEVTEQEAIRDAKGRLHKMRTTKKRK
jgi:hypothetical protein